jgi:low temperature requirement protein LtrA
MPLRRSFRPHPPKLTTEFRERDTVKPLELYFDLVFVLVFTQCTALMAAEGSWEGIARGMLALAVLWWAWAGYAWLTSVVDPEEGSVRIAMLAVTAAVLVAALCVPEAFGDHALLFALAYGAVRVGHVALFVLASRTDPMLRRSVRSLAVSTVIGVGLLVGAAFLDGLAQELLWVLAILLDWGGPALFGLAGWRLVPGHFAERHNLIIILALGESIVALGVGSHVDLTAGVVIAAVLGVALAAAFWWTYFDVVALVTARRLVLAQQGIVRNRLARNSYSYLHFPMVAGIILVALGLEETLADVDHVLASEYAFALLGGVSIYLLAHVALRLQNAHTLNRQRLALALLLFALIPAAVHVPALAALAGLNVLFWLMIIYEHHKYDERRWALRHGLDPDLPGGSRPPRDVRHAES